MNNKFNELALKNNVKEGISHFYLGQCPRCKNHSNIFIYENEDLCFECSVDDEDNYDVEFSSFDQQFQFKNWKLTENRERPDFAWDYKCYDDYYKYQITTLNGGKTFFLSIEYRSKDVKSYTSLPINFSGTSLDCVRYLIEVIKNDYKEPKYDSEIQI